MRASEIRPWWETNKPPGVLKSWESWRADHRATLPLAIQELEITSLYELGCGAGPNLRLLAESTPWMRLGGCDIREDEVLWAREHLPGCQIDLAGTPHVIEAPWEATLSCYTLAYVPPLEVLAQLASIQSRYLVLIEPWGQGEYRVPVEEDVSPKWGHAWPRLMACTGWNLHYRWPIVRLDYLTVLAIYSRQLL